MCSIRTTRNGGVATSPVSPPPRENMKYRRKPPMSWAFVLFQGAPTGLSTGLSGLFVGTYSTLRMQHMQGGAMRAARTGRSAAREEPVPPLDTPWAELSSSCGELVRGVLRPGDCLVVGGAGFEAAVEDADEPVAELAERSVVAGAAGALAVVIGARSW